MQRNIVAMMLYVPGPCVILCGFTGWSVLSPVTHISHTFWSMHTARQLRSRGNLLFSSPESPRESGDTGDGQNCPRGTAHDTRYRGESFDCKSVRVTFLLYNAAEIAH